MSGVDYDFVENYKKVLKSKTSNRPEALNVQRQCMFMAHQYAADNLENDVTCELLEDDLKFYCENFKEILDSPEQLGCFSKDILLTAQKNSKFLKSSLKGNAPPLSELLTQLKDDCSGPNEKHCALKTNPLPTSAEWNHLKNKSMELPRKVSSPREIHENVRTISQQGDAFRQKAQQFSRLDTNFEPTRAHTKQSNSSSVRPIGPSSSITGMTRPVPTLNAGKYTSRVGGWYKKNWGANKNAKVAAEGASRETIDMDEPPPKEEPFRRVETSFKTAGQQLVKKWVGGAHDLGKTKMIVLLQKINEHKKNQDSAGTARYQPVAPMKSLGGKRGVLGKFVPPIKNSSQEEKEKYGSSGESYHEDDEDERLKHIPRNMVELIRSEIMDNGSTVTWDDVAGLDLAKSIIQEIVVWPMLRPDIFTGLRRPPKGILLFGPPGTGKTLIGKCIASQSKSTFFSISASSLTSKWIGDGEKMVRALFAVARVQQPSVVFIDEIDSLLSQRKDTEHDSTRKMKTEFLIQLDGAATSEDDKILIIGATNRPQELDEAARRRLVKRLYIPLPDLEARIQIVTNLMKNEKSDLTTKEVAEVAEHTDGYSGADVKNLCQEASLGPIRAIGSSMMFSISADQVRPVRLTDFLDALKRVRPSVSVGDLEQYVAWDKTYGMGSGGVLNS